MNPEIKQLWLDALRSGKYQQGKSLLRPTENNYCCLGVLCKIAEEQEICKYIPSDEHEGFTIPFEDKENYIGYLYEDSELPWIVRQWAELDSENPKVTLNERNIKEYFKGTMQDNTTVSLAELNDNYCYSFEEIADIIEEQL